MTEAASLNVLAMSFIIICFAFLTEVFCYMC